MSAPKRLARGVLVIVGTRPEIIKMSPIVHELKRRGRPVDILHTGQQSGADMERRFFRQLDLPPALYRIRPCQRQWGHEFQRVDHMTKGILRAIDPGRHRWVLVQGDTNSVLAGAIASARRPDVILGHVEAGLRCGDRTMPEERNRIVVDHLAELLFAPTTTARRNLRAEGVASRSILITGNTIVDALNQNLRKAHRLGSGPDGLGTKDYMLITMHRQEHVDHPSRFRSILEGIRRAVRSTHLRAILPVHPRTADRIRACKPNVPKEIQLVPPLGYLDFLRLEQNARLILTDSGGVQEEACIMGVPCVTFRTCTERPETVAVGANEVCGFGSNGIERAALRMIGRQGGWHHPFGDGQAAGRIVDAITR